MSEVFELAGKKCRTFSAGEGGPVIFVGIMPGGEEFSKIEELLADDEGCFTVFGFECREWNDDFSPWSFDGGNGQVFGSGGKETLAWMKEHAIPYVRSEFPSCSELAIAGYSLSGLFALWSLYESGLFRGAACCSGSLWFGNWDKYADTHKVPENGVVYLSLGGKEPGSGNLLTASIGTQYQKQKKRLEKDSNLRAFTMVMNSGGHFSDPAGRLAKGIKWLAEELSVY